jgi:NAD-dependent aldehyde dehydrogenases
MSDLRDSVQAAFGAMGLDLPASKGGFEARSPIDGKVIHCFEQTSTRHLERSLQSAVIAQMTWQSVPAPVRGELVRRFGLMLREHKASLGRLVSIETGKILSEGLGEVQEMIDMADFAVGQSRQLHGLTIASERPGHAMRETWHPLGPVLIISAFNFPVAVWAWNACLALVCGNSIIWKPSEKAILSAYAVHSLLERAIGECDFVPEGIAGLAIGDARVGTRLVEDRRIALVSATGSSEMGRKVAASVSARFGRSLLELGGNNAAIVAPSADVDLAVRAILFAAVGTAGQRCTSLRRLIVHDGIYDDVVGRLKELYARLAVGNPFDPANLVGPLIDRDAYERMRAALTEAASFRGRIHGGERIHTEHEGAYYVRPALVEMPSAKGPMTRETFAPILYVVRYFDLPEAIAIQNASEHGLSSAIFSTDIRDAEYFLGPLGSDCGIANVNIGTSGAEIGGAFGGEKASGGGRESGSDAWRGYMRRQTATINYSEALPLAQGVTFEL